jgi:hypothetical protein
LSSGGTVDGAVLGGTGSQLAFEGPFTFGADSSIDAAQVEFDNGPTLVQGSYRVTGRTITSGATATFTGNVDVAGSSLQIFGDGFSGGLDVTAATLLSPLTFQDVTIVGATLRSSADLEVTGRFDVASATLAGSGMILLDGTSFVEPNGLNLNRSLVNRGLLIVLGPGINTSVVLAAGVTLTNAAGATLSLQGFVYLGGSGTFINAGTLTATSGSVGLAYTGLAGSTVTVQPNGALRLSSGGTVDGAVLGGTGSQLAFEGPFTFGADSLLAP